MTKIFNEWETDNIQVSDLGMAQYMNLKSKMVPHNFGKSNKKAFEKAKINIIERLVNKIMRSGQGKRKLSGKFIRGRRSCGKKLLSMRIVENAFRKIEYRTNHNPVQVFVTALENSAPREDITRQKKGGIAYTSSVDMSSLKRIDEALKNIAIAAFANSFNKKISAEEALSEEIILASNKDIKSFGIKRRDEVERIAKASR